MNQNLKIGATLISFIRNLVITSTFFVCCISSVFSQTTQNNYTLITKSIYSNVGGFAESLPNDYAANPTKKYPLIIFLHGVGEVGDGSSSSLEVLRRIGIARLLWGRLFPASFSYGGTSYSFIVITPQMKTTNDWTNSIQSVIDYCKKTYRVDENRIYLTGLSLGGVCAWDYSTSTVARGQGLAGTLLVCPGATASSAQLKNIGQSQLPIWVTANSGDPYYSPSMSQNLVAAINNVVPAPPKALVTIFDKAGHDAWTQTYDPAFTQNGMNIYQWMLSHSRSGAQSSPTSPVVLTADAGANQGITLPVSTATLDASGSKVSSGSITSYAWTQVSGPSSATISSASSVRTSVTNLSTAGTYKFQITVKADNGSTATATVTVTVNASSVPPTADAGGTVASITLPVNSVTLNGSASYAASGNNIVSYLWTKRSGPSGGTISYPDQALTSVRDLSAGSYIFDLKVTDNRGASATASITVIVASAVNSAPPTADAGGSVGAITLPLNSITLDGRGSKAASGNSIVSYLWTKRSGPSGGTISFPDEALTSVKDLSAGNYIFDLKVTDNRGASATASITIIVAPPAVNSASPTADAGGSVGAVTLPINSITLDGRGSKAASGNSIVSYLWTKRSGPSGGTISFPDEALTSVKDLSAGNYIFDLKVTDNRGASATASITIIVASASAPPTADAGGSVGAVTLPINSITLDGRGSKATSGNSIVSYRWTKRSGPSGGTISFPDEALTSVKDLSAGNYIFDLKVTDNRGASATASITIIVASGTSNRTMATADTTTVPAIAGNIAASMQPQLEESDPLNITVSPNPVVSDMNLLIKGSAKGKTNIAIYSINGKMLRQQEFNKDGSGSVNKSFNISTLPRGIYLVQVMVDGKFRKVIRVVKQ